MLSKQAITEFQEIYLKTYGKELSFEEAAECAGQLIRLYKAVFLPSLFNQQRKEQQNEQ